MYYRNQNEIKKPWGKILPFLAKNPLRFEIIDKTFEFTYENLNGKLMCLLCSRQFYKKFIIYTALESTTIFLHVFRFQGGVSPCRRH